MSVRTEHSNEYNQWFVTFTCYDWKPLFEITDSYDLVYKWFNYLRNNQIVEIEAYVIMPNHFHGILSLQKRNVSISKVIANGKRFIAYEMVRRLEQINASKTLQDLKNAVYRHEQAKGQKHKVFEPSFDAKPVFTREFLLQKINYIHQNPIRGKWQLVQDFAAYEHSSASYYETGLIKHFKPKDYRD